MYGYDAAKKVKGRKRFALVDTLGLLLSVVVLEASCPERLGGTAVVLEAAQELTQNLSLIWVEQGFSGENFARVMRQLSQADVEIICRQSSGFEPLPKRWIVERTFAWWNHYRRLSKDYELTPEMSESMIRGAMIHLMLRRLAKLQAQAS